MKTLTLSQAWTETIKQWRWIVQQLDEGTDVRVLKRQWLEDNGYKQVKCNCFLCGYASQNNTSIFFCGDCPAILADNSVNEFWCQSSKYNFAYEPRAFLAKLEETYAKYISDMSVL